MATPNPPPPIKVGIIGYGGSAKFFHLTYILPNKDLEVCAFLQRAEAPAEPQNAARNSHCTVDFPQATHHRTADAFFADAAVELVVVTSHTDTHAEFAEKALRAGKHVIVEKPFTRTTEEADQLIALAKESGKFLTVYQNRRYDGNFLTLKHLVEKKALGDITDAVVHYDFENPHWLKHMKAKEYTPGAGMMYGLGTHTFDQVLLLFGKPKSVTGFLRVLRGIDSEVEDSFTVVLQYDDSPLLVTVRTSIVSCVEEPLKYYVRGTKGTYTKHGDDPQEAQSFAGKPATDPDFGVEPASLHGQLVTYEAFDASCQAYDEARARYVGRYPTIRGYIRGYYEDVVAAIRQGDGGGGGGGADGGRPSDLLVDPRTSRDGIRLCELARESHNAGKTVPWS